MVEAMSISNALKKRREGRSLNRSCDSSSDEEGNEDDGLLGGGGTSSDEVSSLLHAYDFDITERIEMVNPESLKGDFVEKST